MKKTLDDYIEKSAEWADRHHQVIYYSVRMAVKMEWDKDPYFSVTRGWLKTTIQEIINKSKHYRLKHTEHNAKTINNQVNQLFRQIPKWKQTYKPYEPPKTSETKWLPDFIMKKISNDHRAKEIFFYWWLKNGNIKEANMLASLVRRKPKPYTKPTIRKWLNEYNRKNGVEIKRGGKREGAGNKIKDVKKEKIINLHKQGYSINKIHQELKTDKRTIKKVLKENKL
ncbi:MAG: hypothetical protein LBC87_01770 [Fibromonadaceae bacterium]|jgi:hypothetical protein|nr:hypothetical protein [Fibromonadaceae bacterium]